MKKQIKLALTLCVFGIALLVALFGKRNDGGGLSNEEAFTESNTENEIENIENMEESEIKNTADKKTVSLSEVSAMDVMCAPSGIAAMPDGAFLVTDTYHKRLWRIQGGTSEVYAGGETVADLYGEPTGGYNDSDPLSSYFKRPWDVAEFLDGWAVSDTENNVIRIVRSKEVKTINGKIEGQQNASDQGTVFNRPTGLSSDEEGNLYVSDTGNGMVRKISPEGVITTEAEGLEDPMGLCWKDGAIYVAETGANRIVKVEGKTVLAVAGNGEDGLKDGPAEEASFSAPRDVAVGDDGTIYVADTLNSAIRQIQDGQVDTLAVRDMKQAELGLTSPTGLLVQGERLYICDNFSRKLFVLEWNFE